MRPILYIIIATALLLTAVPAAPAAAQAPLRVTFSEAQPNFPESITFELRAEAAAGEVAEVQLLYGEARGEAMTVVDLPVTPGQRVEASHTLDTRVYYYPPGTELAYSWVLRDAAGNEVTSEPQRLLYHDARFPWEERTERNVTIYWYRGGASFGDELMATTTRTLDRLQREIGADLDFPVRIYVYASIRDMRSALQSNEVEWIGGAAWPALGVIVGAIEPGDNNEVRRLLPHELSHQVLHQATDNPYGGLPVWFNEGLAVYNQEQRDLVYDEMIDAAAREGRLIPLEALASSFPADPDQATLSYAQSRDMVEFIIERYGTEKVAELVSAFAEATPVAEAVPQVLGRSVDELDADWRATLPPQTSEPPAPASPQTAPPERFEDAPAAPGPLLPVADGEAAWVRWLGQQPSWAIVGGLAVCCLAGVAALGAALLMVLRLIGVDKRVG